MASSKIKILKTSTRHNGFSVEYEVNGEVKGHTFPAEAALLDEDSDGIPDYVQRLQEMEEDVDEVSKFEEKNLKKTEGKEYSFNNEKIAQIRQQKIKKKNNSIKKEGDVYVKL